MHKPKFKPRYEDLPAHRREHIARHFDAAMTELQTAGREFNVPKDRVQAMWADVLRLSDTQIKAETLKRIYLKHVNK
jgi:hypothetical protein